MALWLQNFVNTELKEEEQNIPKRIKSSSSVFMPSVIANGAKLGVAAVARATPLFLPRPEIMYINMLHNSAPPRTYLVCAPPLFAPIGAIAHGKTSTGIKKKCLEKNWLSS